MNANYYIAQLQLKPHPEGGYYRETYRSSGKTLLEGNQRNISTAIYFLLETTNKSHFHRIKSDELWFFHSGEPLEIITLEGNKATSILLGSNLANGEMLQVTIPANTWFASRIKTGKGYSLVSCTVAPGFDFEDFELADKENLKNDFPGNEDLIEELTL